MPSTYDQLVDAQRRVFDLLDRAPQAPPQEMRVAMNRLMSLVRNSDGETLMAFSKWRQEETERRSARGRGQE